MLKPAVLLILTLLLARPFAVLSQNDVKSDVQKLETFLNSVDSRYVDDVETSKLVEKGVRSMLEELDPHSVYLNAEQYRKANEPLKGKFKGLGIRFQTIQDTITVLDIIENSAAEAMGLKTGDRILAIGADTIAGKGLSASKVSNMLRADSSDNKPLLIDRDGMGLMMFELKRSDVAISSVPAYFVIEKGVGYIKLSRFSSNSLNEFRDALSELKKKKIDNLILDLRGNSGGYLNVAVRITDEFLDNRKLIVYTEGKHQPRKDTYATSGGLFTKGNLIVLIDENSASASEILAGAVQDWDRGLIIGRRSFGKGLVQRTVEFNDGSAMRLTISRYYTPTGRSIQKPYEGGNHTAYRTELRNRALRGELYSRDSIRVSDSLVFFTPSGRKVYGGGGIVPDVFVPADSAINNPCWSEIAKSGLLYSFAIKNSASRGSRWRDRYPDASSFAHEFKPDIELLNEFEKYLNHRGVECNPDDWSRCADFVSRQLHINLARFIYGYPAYWQVLAHYDKTVQAALHEIEDGTIKELGLNQK